MSGPRESTTETATAAPTAETPAVTEASTSGGVNINSATQTELESLPGIGPALAKRIIAGRPYRSLPDLDRVRGLGPRKLEALQGVIVFE